MIKLATRVVSAMSLGLVLNACALFDPNAQSYDYTPAAGTLVTDAVRDTATAITIAKKSCPDAVDWAKQHNYYWQAFLVDGKWNVFTSISSKNPSCQGWTVPLNTQTGKPISGCAECVTLD